MLQTIGLGFTSSAQKTARRARAGGPPLKISNREVNTVEDGEEDCSLEDWIFPTVNGGLRNWEVDLEISCIGEKVNCGQFTVKPHEF